MKPLLRAVVVVAGATVAVVALSSPSTRAQQAAPRVDFTSEVQPHWAVTALALAAR